MFRYFTRIEKVIITVLITVIIISGIQLVFAFQRETSIPIPDFGGVYTEGLVGQVQLINPLFSENNPVDRDISRLVFAGLTKYNPETGKIEDDLATSEISEDKKTYTFTLKEGISWHDGEAVTADDVIFTYQQVIQDPKFKNEFLKEVFHDIQIAKIDERKATFTLPAPYSFFLANVTLGLVPRHILEMVPVENLDKSDFNLNPIGAGPYEFIDIYPDGKGIAEVSLKSFANYHRGQPKLESFILKVFPSHEDLMFNLSSLSGVKSVAFNDLKSFGENTRFSLLEYELPQYVALFLNTDRKILDNEKTRFGFLLATDKNELMGKLEGRWKIVDTPILETKGGLDIEYNELRAKGAFFDTEWKLPGKGAPLAEKEKEEDIDSAKDYQEEVVDIEMEKIDLKIMAEGDSWVDLVVDGLKQPSFILKKGEEKKLEAQEEILFRTVGNAGGLRLLVNDSEIKPLGEEGEVVHNFAISKENILDLWVNPPQPEPESEEEQPAEEPKEEGPEKIEKDVDRSLVRRNKEGEALTLTLVTASQPKTYVEAAKILQEQWLKAGAELLIEVYDPGELQKKIRSKDYDILLYGQNLGYNLDAFPFWHSSQAGENGLNLSQYRSFTTDNLLIGIRSALEEETKKEKLKELKKVIIEDTPAIFLYTPYKYFAVDKKVKGVLLNKMALSSDRFANVNKWYEKERKISKEERGLIGFLKWMLNKL